jgi:hypothetical protein
MAGQSHWEIGNRLSTPGSSAGNTGTATIRKANLVVLPLMRFLRAHQGRDEA